MSQTTPLFAECRRCGERWKFATLPVEVSKLPNRATCPNCADSQLVALCHTTGPHAVTGPRAGKTQ